MTNLAYLLLFSFKSTINKQQIWISIITEPFSHILRYKVSLDITSGTPSLYSGIPTFCLFPVITMYVTKSGDGWLRGIIFLIIAQRFKKNNTRGYCLINLNIRLHIGIGKLSGKNISRVHL